jgi:endonuclease/exonuclease/phosphatase family metal-dependent hydrolase
MIRAILCLLLVGAAAPSWAETAPEELTVVSYNVQFLPGMASAMNKRGNNPYRLERIAQEMSKFDIIGLQEIFEEGPRNAVFEGLKEAWDGTAYMMHSPKPFDRYTGGCAIISRYPIIETNAILYDDYSHPKDYGFRADGFAAKGCIHARIAFDEGKPDEFVDVFATHLEARADELRPKQYAQMAGFIKEKSSPKHPILVLGDFNTRGMPEYREDPKSQYNQLMAEWKKARPDGGIRDIWLEVRGDDWGGTTEQESTETGKRIDYIFLGNPEEAALQLVPKAMEVNGYLDPVSEALSDHSAVIGTFALER